MDGWIDDRSIDCVDCGVFSHNRGTSDIIEVGSHTSGFVIMAHN